MLKGAGLTPGDVTLVDLRPQEMLPAIAAGGIEAFDTWSPTSPTPEGPAAEAVLGRNQGAASETFDVVVMRSYLDANSPLVEKLLQALIDAEACMKAHPDEAITAVADIVGMNHNELAPI